MKAKYPKDHVEASCSAIVLACVFGIISVVTFILGCLCKGGV